MSIGRVRHRPEHRLRRPSAGDRGRLRPQQDPLGHPQGAGRRAQAAEAASVFDADKDCFSAAKKLIDTKNKRYKAVSAVFSQVTTYWKKVTLPFTEDGIRLLRREHVGRVRGEDRPVPERTGRCRGAAWRSEYSQLLSEARQKLGRLFNASDYPQSLAGLFRISVDYPALEPDPSLVQVSNTLYQRECRKIKSRFEEAVTLAEQSFAAEFRKLIEHIVTRLQGLNDGTSKQFREENLTQPAVVLRAVPPVVHRQQHELERLVEDAKQAVAGYRPDWLEDSQPLRDVVRGSLEQVQAALDGLMVARPKRKISWED